MNLLRSAVALLALSVAAVLTPAAPARDNVEIDPDHYAAIAFSPSTGAYGYGYDCGTLGQAQRLALSHCREADARVICWVRFGWAALVIAEDGSYGYDTSYGGGSTSRDALEKATRQLRKNSDSPVKIALIVCSGDVRPQVITRKSSSVAIGTTPSSIRIDGRPPVSWQPT
jgi:serine/threonine-protein kinase